MAAKSFDPIRFRLIVKRQWLQIFRGTCLIFLNFEVSFRKKPLYTFGLLYILCHFVVVIRKQGPAICFYTPTIMLLAENFTATGLRNSAISSLEKKTSKILFTDLKMFISRSPGESFMKIRRYRGS